MIEKITINKHSSIRIQGDKVIYFDPYEIEEETHDADVIFITHDHYDHFDPASINKILEAVLKPGPIPGSFPPRWWRWSRGRPWTSTEW